MFFNGRFLREFLTDDYLTVMGIMHDFLPEVKVKGDPFRVSLFLIHLKLLLKFYGCNYHFIDDGLQFAFRKLSDFHF